MIRVRSASRLAILVAVFVVASASAVATSSRARAVSSIFSPRSASSTAAGAGRGVEHLGAVVVEAGGETEVGVSTTVGGLGRHQPRPPNAQSAILESGRVTRADVLRRSPRSTPAAAANAARE
jgi:hypothetical protein